jgi:hypothetical protein
MRFSRTGRERENEDLLGNRDYDGGRAARPIARLQRLRIHGDQHSHAGWHEAGFKNVKMRNGIPSHNPSDACGSQIVVPFENVGGYAGSAGALAYARPFGVSGTRIHLKSRVSYGISKLRELIKRRRNQNEYRAQ